MNLNACKIVTPGLDPGVHFSNAMDGRIKPGHDGLRSCDVE